MKIRILILALAYFYKKVNWIFFYARGGAETVPTCCNVRTYLKNIPRIEQSPVKEMFTLERVQNINVAEFFQLPVLMAPDYTFSNRKKT